MRRRNIPGSAIGVISEWVGVCRLLGVLADIEPSARYRRFPASREVCREFRASSNRSGRALYIAANWPDFAYSTGELSTGRAACGDNEMREYSERCADTPACRHLGTECCIHATGHE
jgi:hypothetical protein